MNITSDTLAGVQAEERARGEKAWYFLKFMEGGEHLGAAIVEAYGPSDAFLETTSRNIDPGRGSVILTTVAEPNLPAVEYRNRLLTKAEVESFWPDQPGPKEAA